MKRHSIIITGLWLSIAVLLLSACTDYMLEQELAHEGITGDSCYVNLRIVNGSAANTTRASETEENAIYDGILCIFEGTNATNATLKTATVIDQLIYNPHATNTVAGGTAPNSIYVTQRLATGTHDYHSGKSLFALALLNTTSAGFTVRGDNGNELYLGNRSLTGNTLAQMKTLVIPSVGSPEEHVGLFMSNAGGTLVEISNDNLFDTHEEATANNAGRLTISVERAAAKVTVTNNITNGTISNIDLDGNNSRHPKVHTMRWAVNNLNTESYVLSGGIGHTFTPLTFANPDSLGYTGYSGASDFDVYQHRAESGEAIYIAENSNSDAETEIIVELRLKDESNVLLGDCYLYELGTAIFFTSAEKLIQHFKQGWTGGAYNNYPAISDRSADEVLRNIKISFDPNSTNGAVIVTLTNPQFAAEDAANLNGNSGRVAALNSLANFLSGTLTGYRGGKMYYTFKIKTGNDNHVQRNKYYDLSLTNTSLQSTIHHQRATVTFKFDQGTTGQTASFSNNDWFVTSGTEASSVNWGSNFTLIGKDDTRNQTKLQSGVKQTEALESNAINFSFTPSSGHTFTPTSASFKGTRYGTDGGEIVVSWVNGDGTVLALNKETFKLRRDNETPSVTEKSFVINGKASSSTCGLRFNIHTLDSNKNIGLSDIVIQGTIDTPLSGGATTSLGRPMP